MVAAVLDIPNSTPPYLYREQHYYTNFYVHFNTDKIGYCMFIWTNNSVTQWEYFLKMFFLITINNVMIHNLCFIAKINIKLFQISVLFFLARGQTFSQKYSSLWKCGTIDIYRNCPVYCQCLTFKHANLSIMNILTHFKMYLSSYLIESIINMSLWSVLQILVASWNNTFPPIYLAKKKLKFVFVSVYI